MAKTSHSDIADFLLSEGLHLTALELYAELLEAGQEVPNLAKFFANPNNFVDVGQSSSSAGQPRVSPPSVRMGGSGTGPVPASPSYSRLSRLSETPSKQMSKLNISRSESQMTLDSIDRLTRYSEDTDRREEDRVAVLEYELRTARENLQQLRTALAHMTAAEEERRKRRKKRQQHGSGSGVKAAPAPKAAVGGSEDASGTNNGSAANPPNIEFRYSVAEINSGTSSVAGDSDSVCRDDGSGKWRERQASGGDTLDSLVSHQSTGDAGSDLNYPTDECRGHSSCSDDEEDDHLPVRPHEQRLLNHLVNDYLIGQGYKISAITFADECEEDLDDQQQSNGSLLKLLRGTDGLVDDLKERLSANQLEPDAEKSVSVEIQTDSDLPSDPDNGDQQRLETETYINEDASNENDEENPGNDSPSSEELKTADDPKMSSTGNAATAELEAALEQLSILREQNAILTSEVNEVKRINEKLTIDLKNGPPSQEIPKTAPCIQRPTEVRLGDEEKMAAVVEPERQTPTVLRPEGEREDGDGACAVDPAIPVTVLEKDTLGESPFHPPRPVSAMFQSQLKSAALPVAVQNAHKYQMEASLVETLGSVLPRVVSSLVLSVRGDVVPPLIIQTINLHQDPTVRDNLIGLLFNLMKRPDSEARGRILVGLIWLLEQTSGGWQTESSRIETELLPHLWQQLEHKNAERRLLVCESVNVLSGYLSKELCSSLLFSMMEQLARDSEASVAASAIKSLGVLSNLIDDKDKLARVKEVTVHALRHHWDNKEVMDSLLTTLFPVVVIWMIEEDSGQYFAFLMEILEQTVNVNDNSSLTEKLKRIVSVFEVIEQQFAVFVHLLLRNSDWKPPHQSGGGHEDLGLCGQETDAAMPTFLQHLYSSREVSQMCWSWYCANLRPVLPASEGDSAETLSPAWALTAHRIAVLLQSSLLLMGKLDGSDLGNLAGQSTTVDQPADIAAPISLIRNTCELLVVSGAKVFGPQLMMQAVLTPLMQQLMTGLQTSPEPSNLQSLQTSVVIVGICLVNKYKMTVDSAETSAKIKGSEIISSVQPLMSSLFQDAQCQPSFSLTLRLLIDVGLEEAAEVMLLESLNRLSGAAIVQQLSAVASHVVGEREKSRNLSWLMPVFEATLKHEDLSVRSSLLQILPSMITSSSISSQSCEDVARVISNLCHDKDSRVVTQTIQQIGTLLPHSQSMRESVFIPKLCSMVGFWREQFQFADLQQASALITAFSYLPELPTTENLMTESVMPCLLQLLELTQTNVELTTLENSVLFLLSEMEAARRNSREGVSSGARKLSAVDSPQQLGEGISKSSSIGAHMHQQLQKQKSSNPFDEEETGSSDFSVTSSPSASTAGDIKPLTPGDKVRSKMQKLLQKLPSGGGNGN